MSEQSTTIKNRGYFRYKFTSSEIPTNWNIPDEVDHEYAIDLTITYKWTNDVCTISQCSWGLISASMNLANNSPFIKPNNIKLFINNAEPTTNYTVSGNIGQGSITFDDNDFDFTGQSLSYFTINLKYNYEDTDQYVLYTVEVKNVKITKTSKYLNNVIFTKAGVEELLTKVKEYPIIDIETVNATATDENNNNIWSTYTDGKPCVKIVYGDENKNIIEGYPENISTTGYKYVAVGSNISFPNSTIATSPTAPQGTGTVRIIIDNIVNDVEVNGLASGSGDLSINGSLVPAIDSQLSSSTAGYNLGSTTTQWNILYARGAVFGNADESGSQAGLDAAYEIKPYANNTGSLGTLNNKWGKVYSNKYIVGSTTSTVPTGAGEIGEIVFVLRN